MLEVLTHFRVVLRSLKGHYLRVERSCDVSGAQLWAMAEIQRSPGIKVGELARRLAVHQSTASNLIARLRERGSVTRRRVGGDQRVVRLYLTEKGQNTLEAAPQPHVGMLQDALKQLPDSSLRSLRRELARIIALMNVRDPGAGATPLSEI